MARNGIRSTDAEYVGVSFTVLYPYSLQVINPEPREPTPSVAGEPATRAISPLLTHSAHELHHEQHVSYYRLFKDI